MAETVIPAGTVKLGGDLNIPSGAQGIVIFAHGSGSSRHSRRNQFLARELQKAGLGTLLMDLLTEEEEERDAVTAELRFDIRLLAARVTQATDWLKRQEQALELRLGYFGSSTGAAAALIAASTRGEEIAAVVSRGGRPDLADAALPQVLAPTLLIVGGADEVVLELNRQALARMDGTRHHHLVIVPGATHLFEETGALEQVARLAADWFKTHLAS